MYSFSSVISCTLVSSLWHLPLEARAKIWASFERYKGVCQLCSCCFVAEGCICSMGNQYDNNSSLLLVPICCDVLTTFELVFDKIVCIIFLFLTICDISDCGSKVTPASIARWCESVASPTIPCKLISSSSFLLSVALLSFCWELIVFRCVIQYGCYI